MLRLIQTETHETFKKVSEPTEQPMSHAPTRTSEVRSSRKVQVIEPSPTPGATDPVSNPRDPGAGPTDPARPKPQPPAPLPPKPQPGEPPQPRIALASHSGKHDNARWQTRQAELRQAGLPISRSTYCKVCLRPLKASRPASTRVCAASSRTVINLPVPKSLKERS